MWGSQNLSQLWRSWNDWLWYAKLGCLRPNTCSKLGLKHIQWTHKRLPGQSVVRNWSASRQVFSAKLWRMSRKCDESAEMWLLHFASNRSPSMSVLTMAHPTVWVRVKTLEPCFFSQKLLANGYPSSSSHSNDPRLLEVFNGIHIPFKILAGAGLCAVLQVWWHQARDHGRLAMINKRVGRGNSGNVF